MVDPDLCSSTLARKCVNSRQITWSQSVAPSSSSSVFAEYLSAEARKRANELRAPSLPATVRFAVPPMAIIGMAAAPSSVAMVSVPAQRLRSVFFRGASNLLYFPENRDFIEKESGGGEE